MTERRACSSWSTTSVQVGSCPQSKPWRAARSRYIGSLIAQSSDRATRSGPSARRVRMSSQRSHTRHGPGRHECGVRVRPRVTEIAPLYVDGGHRTVRDRARAPAARRVADEQSERFHWRAQLHVVAARDAVFDERHHEGRRRDLEPRAEIRPQAFAADEMLAPVPVPPERFVPGVGDAAVARALIRHRMIQVMGPRRQRELQTAREGIESSGAAVDHAGDQVGKETAAKHGRVRPMTVALVRAPRGPAAAVIDVAREDAGRSRPREPGGRRLQRGPPSPRRQPSRSAPRPRDRGIRGRPSPGDRRRPRTASTRSPGTGRAATIP